MGSTEQYRMKQPGTAKRDARFVPDESLEAALIQDIEKAWNNYLAYNALCQEYEEVT